MERTAPASCSISGQHTSYVCISSWNAALGPGRDRGWGDDYWEWLTVPIFCSTRLFSAQSKYSFLL